LKLAYADNIGQVHANRMHRIHKNQKFYVFHILIYFR